jgi:hypothetical protein
MSVPSFESWLPPPFRKTGSPLEFRPRRLGSDLTMPAVWTRQDQGAAENSRTTERMKYLRPVVLHRVAKNTDRALAWHAGLAPGAWSSTAMHV